MSVKIENITKLYGKQKALDDVSFEIVAGEVVGFLGPNGAGKSTMMKIICCFLPQTTGKVTVHGFDTTEDSIAVRKKVGYLPEHNPLYHDMYVKEYLSFIGAIHMPRAKVKERVKYMIELTGLAPEQHKKIGALSKGYRQRVGLAQAMIHDPEVLILDEPTTGLDPNQLVEIRALIRDIGKEKTVLLSTHIMQEVESICDRVIIINNGSIVADDRTEVLQQNTNKSLTFEVEFESAVPINQLQNMDGINSVTLINEKSFAITCDPNNDIRSQLFEWAVKNQHQILTLQTRENSLEQVFRSLTNS
jgi:gliding motility-associated transport system ATP-binding protein